jgi:bilirubin oxidase
MDISKDHMLTCCTVALKDVVWLNTNEQVNVIARYAPWDGFYMFHCHNLIHEDHEMMAAFNVTALTDLGYDEKTTFIDPMETRYRNKFFSESDLTSRSGDFADSAIEAKVKFFNELEAYRNKAGVESALENYWNTKVTSTTASSTKKGSATTLATSASSPAAAVASSSGTPAAVAASSATPAVVASSSAAPVVSSSSAAVASPST